MLRIKMPPKPLVMRKKSDVIWPHPRYLQKKQMNRSQKISGTAIRIPFYLVKTTVIAMALVIGVAGCSSSARINDTTKGGAIFGAGVGLLIGALAGRPGEGLAAGVAVGATQGAYEGWRQEQDDQRTREITAAIHEAKASGSAPPGEDAPARASEELTRFLGVWAIEGWAQQENGSRLTIQAHSNGNVQMQNYVQLALMDINIDGNASTIWGEALLGYDDDVGYTYNSRVSTLPEPFHATGSFDAGSRTFTFQNGTGRMSFRFENPDRFILETFDNRQTVEHYQFTRK